jgi:alpha-tubulin suppressor-like RCC1 family protein
MPPVTSLNALSHYTSNVIASDITDTSNNLIQDITYSSNSISNRITDLYTYDISFQQNVTVNNDLTVNGNLTVDGTTTSINTDAYTTEILEIVSTNINDDKPVLKVVESGTVGNIIEVYKEANEVLSIDNSGKLITSDVQINGTLTTTGTINGVTPAQFSDIANAQPLYTYTITSMATGGHHSVLIANSSTVIDCGLNNYGQINGQIGVTQNFFNNTTYLFRKISQVACGDNHTVFLKTDGTVMACGNNNIGQLGDGTTVIQSNPVYVLTSGSDQSANKLLGVTQVACGDNHTVFLKTDATAMACGGNFYGQLGNRTNDAVNNPTVVLRTFTEPLGFISQVSCGRFHTVFLKIGGTVVACGKNDSGQLGDGTTDDSNKEVNVLTSGSDQTANKLEDVTQVACGRFHTVFLKTDGTVMACGYNNSGELGDGTNVNQSNPVYVLTSGSDQSANRLSGILEIVSSSSASHFITRNTDNSIIMWGDNSDSQLGNGGNTVVNKPTVIDFSENFKQ